MLTLARSRRLRFHNAAKKPSSVFHIKQLVVAAAHVVSNYEPCKLVSVDQDACASSLQ